MNRLLFIGWFIVALSLKAIGQQKQIDSLMAVIEKDPGSSALNRLGNIYFKEGKIEQVQELFEMVINNTINDEKKLGQVYGWIGAIYSDNGWVFEAEDYYLKSLEKAYASSDTATISVRSSNLALIYANTNQYQKSIELSEKSIALAEMNAEVLSINYNNIADSYIKMGKPYEAIGPLYKSLHYLNSNAIRDSIALSIAHHNLGECFTMLNQSDSAINHIKTTLIINTVLMDTIGLIYDYALQGKYFRSISKMREAVKAFNKSLNLHRNYGFVDNSWDNYEYLICLDNLTLCYKELGLTDSAFYLVNLSKARFKEIRDEENKKRMEKNYASLESNIRKQLKQKSDVRKYQIQYYAIAVGLVLVTLIYLAFSRFDKQRKYSKYVSTFILLLIFEFVLVWLDPYISKLTGDVPLFNFLVNILVAVSVIPIHRGGEKLFNKVVLDIKFRDVEE